MSDHDMTAVHPKNKKVKPSFHLEERGLLVILSGERFGQTHILDEETLTLGRGDECDISFHDDEISKEHCQITVEKGYFFLEDLGSSNGTYLDGKKLKKKVLLSYSDRIVMGNTIIRFFMEESL